MSDLRAPDLEVRRQISALPASTRPLLICDVDEVVLHLVRHLEEMMQERGLAFQSYVYRLTGNILDTRSGKLADDTETHDLLQEFFDSYVSRQSMVTGASTALESLSEDMDVVFLTNIPGSSNKPVREKLLASYGMNYPVIANHGAKGPAAAALSARRELPLVFIDDAGQNLTSVRENVANVTLIQFIADSRFRANVKATPGISLLTGDWAETAAYIRNMMEQ